MYLGFTIVKSSLLNASSKFCAPSIMNVLGLLCAFKQRPLMYILWKQVWSSISANRYGLKTNLLSASCVRNKYFLIYRHENDSIIYESSERPIMYEI
jgi:hypothetical protein